MFTSTLNTSNSASNTKSKTPYRPKRRPNRAPEFKSISTLFKKSSYFLIHSSPSLDPSSSLVPRFSSSFQFHLDTPKFLAHEMLTPEETEPDEFEDF